MRYAFILLGLMTLIVFVGGLLVLSKKAEAPAPLEESLSNPK